MIRGFATIAAATVVAFVPAQLNEAVASDAAVAIAPVFVHKIVQPADPRAFARRATRSDAEYACLLRLWTRESNWRANAKNPRSSAYGIAQMLHEKSTDPITQVRHGLAYIQQRYGDACTALNHSLTHSWY